MTIKSKAFKVLSWALGATLISAIAWAAVGWNVDGYGNIKVARSTVLLAVGQASNCKIDITGSTLSVVGSNGSALSASNPCSIGFSDSAVATFTSPVSVTFGATSDTDGNDFGLTNSVNWASSMPWILSVVSDGGTPATYKFAISRTDYDATGPNAADVCQKADTDCDAQIDMMFLDSGLTLANWVNKQAVAVGWFAGTYATTGGAWTFTKPSGAGFNRLWSVPKWTFPVAQNGADAGSHWKRNNAGDTLPTFANDFVYYQMLPGRFFVVNYNQSNTSGGTAGAGSNAMPSLSLPMAGDAANYTGIFQRSNNGVGVPIHVTTTQTSALIGALYFTSDGSSVYCASFNHANIRLLQGTIIYRAL